MRVLDARMTCPVATCSARSRPFVDQPVFARDIVRFKGEAVAAVRRSKPDIAWQFDLKSFPVAGSHCRHCTGMAEATDAEATQLHRRPAPATS